MNAHLFRALWIATLIVSCSVQAWMSVKNNETHGGYFWWIFLAGQVPIWAYVSARSKELVFDGILYDVIAVPCYMIVMAYFCKQQLTQMTWIGLGIAISGIVIMKL